MYALIFTIVLIPSGFHETGIERSMSLADCEARLDELTNEAADAAEGAGVEIAILGECQPEC